LLAADCFLESMAARIVLNADTCTEV